MPLSLEEYQVAQMYMVTKMQHQNTNSTEGVDVLENRNFEDSLFGKGRYTSKVYRLQRKSMKVVMIWGLWTVGMSSTLNASRNGSLRRIPAIQENRVATVQCLSGTGSLRVGGEFLSRHYHEKTEFIPQPTWETIQKSLP